jgi:hypothetical protein
VILRVELALSGHPRRVLAVDTSALFAEHGPLVDAAERLLRHLRDSQSHLAHGPDVYYWQHGQFAERLESLAMY